MKILVVGSGGREHAVIWKLLQSKHVDEVICAPGNGGISDIAKCFSVSAEDVDGMVALAKSEKVDFCVVTPDDPLALGMVDAMEAAGIPSFGPTKAAAQIEASKVFAKELMQKAGVPTAKAGTFTDTVNAKKYIDEVGAPIVIKADGLAKGKGVIIAQTKEEAYAAVDSMMQDKAFGEAGNRVLIEEFLEGVEASIMCFCDGEHFVPMISSQDHKRLLDGDSGKNTGGMGAFAPTPNYTPEIAKITERDVIAPTVKAMADMGCPFKGVLYAGLMLTKKGPYVLEYNSRFGDPETQVVLPMLEGDLYEIMRACRDGNLDKCSIKFADGGCCIVVMVSGGYPDKYPKGMEIHGLDAKMPKNATGQTVCWVIHAGTKRDGDKYLTNGGRVLGVVAKADSLQEAISTAYENIAEISFEGAFYRKDIGGKFRR